MYISKLEIVLRIVCGLLGCGVAIMGIAFGEPLAFLVGLAIGVIALYK